MGISFTSIVEDTRTIDVPFSGGDLSVTYKPTSLSPRHIQRVQEELSKGDETNIMAVAELFCTIVTDWNLTGPLGEGDDLIGDGETVPMEPRFVGWLPSSVLQYITEQIGEDANPKGKTKRN